MNEAVRFLYVYAAPEFGGGLRYVVAEMPNNDDGYIPGGTVAAFRNVNDAHVWAYDEQDKELAFARPCLVHILPSAEIPEE